MRLIKVTWSVASQWPATAKGLACWKCSTCRLNGIGSVFMVRGVTFSENESLWYRRWWGDDETRPRCRIEANQKISIPFCCDPGQWNDWLHFSKKKRKKKTTCPSSGNNFLTESSRFGWFLRHWASLLFTLTTARVLNLRQLNDVHSDFSPTFVFPTL